MHQRLVAANLTAEESRQLGMSVLLSIGMKVMVTENIATSTNLANRSRNVITDIVLDKR
ncbi:hypothetical protein L210DRAFT_3539564 [Boletus edulis BED1]|uniref:Uncharacterized protein n=1 Tax=Boletus edulis BED1 TaxID=1328754 RepID=A0AAD4GEJ3_BOLED|nr:hypothetical protein L210DRAFT_3539564 [Boletus edulis BED1]